jgi:hypothetical protein
MRPWLAVEELGGEEIEVWWDVDSDWVSKSRIVAYYGAWGLVYGVCISMCGVSL